MILLEKFPTDGYRYVRKWIIHVHIKDGVRRGRETKPEWTLVGEGEVAYKEQFKALKEDGYEGYLSLETHRRPKRKLPEEIVMRPGGKEFSYGAEEASEICMRNLLRILSSI